MGIERFFSSVQDNNITNLISNFTYILEKKLITKNLYVDFNSIVYVVTFKILKDFNYLLYRIIINNYENDKTSQVIIKEYGILDELNRSDKLDVKEFSEYYNSEKMDNVVLNKVETYVINILQNYIEPFQLHNLYLAVDGTPLKSKIIEQKKRRYMGVFINKIKEKIFNKYKEQLSKNRLIFENNKINWSTLKITPGTVFMHKLNELLSSDNFKNKINDICGNLQSYVFSGPYIPGEGEKKIVDALRATKQEKDSYVIYSPDSDVILLSLLLNCEFSPNDKRRITKLTMLRHNQQKDKYDVIDIDKLRKNIFGYISDKHKLDYKFNIDKIINDVVFVLTIFGNDFVPKVQSFNIRKDFQKIIDIYSNILINNNFKYIVGFDKTLNKKVINYDIFIKLIAKLQNDEGGNLQKMYMDSHYRNYKKLKKLFNAQDNLNEKLNDFLKSLREFNNDIESGDVNKIINKWKNNKIMNILKKTTKLKNNNANDANSYIDSYINYYRKNKQFPKIAVVFRRYHKSLKDDFHMNRLKESMKYLGSVTDYDKEIYKFENMMDEYKKRLNAEKISLGYVSIDPKRYVWKTENIISSVKKYYDEFFGIKDISIDNAKMSKLVEEYLMGFIWVFDYYFNNFDEKYNYENPDVWYYPYENPPLFKQIYDYIKKHKNIFNTLNNRLNKYKVSRNEYFNALEHLMYISPAPEVKYLLPKEYYDFIDNSNFYPNVQEAVDNFWNNPSSSDEIDCRGKTFLNKCNLEILKISKDSYKDYINKDVKFMNKLRKIKLNDYVKERKRLYVNNNINDNSISENSFDNYISDSDYGNHGNHGNHYDKYHNAYLKMKYKYLEAKNEIIKLK